MDKITGSIIENSGLVLEGGGMRGLYTCGVLDAFLEKEIYFKNCIGVSAGICHACSYATRQKGRAKKVVLDYMNDKEYCGVGVMLKTGSYFSEEFLYHRIPEKLVPVDEEAFYKGGTKLYSTVTNCRTGKAEYMEVKDMWKDIDLVRASASLPMMSTMVKIGNEKYLDGGIADSIPIKECERRGLVKNVVVLTQPRDYRKKPNSLYPLMKLRYLRHGAMCEDIKNRHIVYNETLDYLKEREKAGEVLIIAPEKTFGIGRLERDREKLEEVYRIGYEDGLRAAEKIKTFVR